MSMLLSVGRNRRILKRVLYNGLVQWLGEAAVGLIPWLAYELTHSFSKVTQATAICPLLEPSRSINKYLCEPVPENPLQEICILAVVISGLAVLSSFQFSTGRRRPSRTPFAYLMLVPSILSLVAGAIFYSLISAHLDEGMGRATYAVLGIALIGSLFLALEEAYVDAKRGLPD